MAYFFSVVLEFELVFENFILQAGSFMKVFFIHLQLLDFRNVVARMLGLDINTLAIPDYEIISRLEKLIQAHHTHAFTTMSMEEAVADMEDGFFSGHEDYHRTMGNTEASNFRRSRERVKRKAARARARSLSPTRKVDPRVYWSYWCKDSS